ncbi:NAD(P)/FAD-dependent oxidoreductase [Pseudomonas sp. AOB-7]|uniref:flavin-containing monooxygenase n=1 Tax=Pseudomonas sp. AOB-7 TaxID=2482750 RepID=UPI000EFBF95D|nr:NAD(P)/FAD-dependent oxidoreductase [Pseudomonas sp. AOB-7]RMH82367.1 NAD(P)/FAD-dependent oxidoreductase [Pseudomonas sp. AOB-7]
MKQHYDVLIVGAGLSGIGTACHMAKEMPYARIAIIERRKAIGGTWDLFRYPGIRSDSDMFSFGYSFRPWNELKVLADGPAIRRYIVDTAREYGIEQKIHFGLRTIRADWSSEQQRWSLECQDEDTGEFLGFTCNYLVSCTGYYDYDQGFLPDFPSEERFQGLRIHPQHWPENLDYRGKRVVVIGSGATAVTLVPSMAESAEHVTMLQRSPSYVFSVPGRDKLSSVLRRFLPESLVYGLARKRNIVLQRQLYKASKRWPNLVRSWLLSGVKKQVGKDFDMRHFTPRYQPWDERICAVPDADLFKALREGRASIETDTIESFTETGIKLHSGKELKADIIVTATGLKLQTCGGMELVVDGEPRSLGRLMTYKGAMLQDIPNMGFVFGYTNAPWTLKVDITAAYLCRLFNYMRSRNLKVVTPRAPVGEVQVQETVLGSLQSGYIKRGEAILPRQGRGWPWRVLHDFERDRAMLLGQPIEDAALEFKGA